MKIKSCKYCKKDIPKIGYRRYDCWYEKTMFCDRKCQALGRTQDRSKIKLKKCSRCPKFILNTRNLYQSNYDQRKVCSIDCAKRARYDSYIHKKIEFCECGKRLSYIPPSVRKQTKRKRTCYQCYWHSLNDRKLSEEQKRRQSATMKKLIAKGEYVVRKGEEATWWKGGISLKPGYNALIKANRRAREVNAKGSHTSEEWEALKAKYHYICLCCKRQEPYIKLCLDHILPLSLGGSNDISNIQPLCKSCNSIKSTKTVDYRPTPVKNNVTINI